MAVMKNRVVLLMVLFAFAVAAFAATPEEEIRAVLDQQASAWNRGDLDAYMAAGYWNSPDLTFFSGGTVTRGYQPTLERYRRGYQTTGREMGKLDFSDVTVEMLGPEAAVARGRFHLAMKNGTEPRGIFTVIFRKFPQGWRIIHDHSSTGS
jgi:beta-aspartyl-peptidase (threonine type)